MVRTNTLRMAVATLAALASFGTPSIADASPTFTVESEGFSTGCVGPLCSNSPTNSITADVSFTTSANDYVNLLFFTNGAGNDEVASVELYPSYNPSTGACTGTSFAATIQADYSVGTKNEVTRAKYDGSSPFDCLTATLPSGDTAGWSNTEDDVHASSAVTWSLDTSNHETCIATCNTLSKNIGADDVQLADAFWSGNASLSTALTGTWLYDNTSYGNTTGDLTSVNYASSDADVAIDTTVTLAKDADLALETETISGS